MKTQNQGGSVKSSSQEREVSAINGWLMLGVNLAMVCLGVFLCIRSIYELEALGQSFPVIQFVSGILCVLLAVILLIGHFTLQPNQARVLILFVLPIVSPNSFRTPSARSSESCWLEAKRRDRIGTLSVCPVIRMRPGNCARAAPIRARTGRKPSLTDTLPEAKSPSP